MSRKGRSGRQKGRSGVVATTPSVWYRKDVDSGFEINNPCFEKYVYAHTHTHTHILTHRAITFSPGKRCSSRTIQVINHRMEAISRSRSGDAKKAAL